MGEDDSDNVVAVSVVRRESFTDFKALIRTEQVNRYLIVRDYFQKEIFH